MEYRVGGIRTNLRVPSARLARGRFPRRQVFDGVHRGAQGAARQADRLEEDDEALDAALAAAALHALEGAPQPTAGNGAGATSAPTSERSAWQRGTRF